MFFRKRKQANSDSIYEMLRKAGPSTLQGTKEIIAVAILYEKRPVGTAMPAKHKLADIFIEDYKGPGWIPAGLTIDHQTPVAIRQLTYGQEIREDAGLDTSGSNRLLAEMLADLVSLKGVDRASAIAFRGLNNTLGNTFFAVLAK